MMVWILEMTPDYEQSTRVGIYTSPSVAWDDLLRQVNDHVLEQVDSFDLSVGVAPGGVDGSRLSRRVLRVGFRSGDEITLKGEPVLDGSIDGSSAPSLNEWLQLRTLGDRLREMAVKAAMFECSGDPAMSPLAFGRWVFTRDS